MEFIFVSVACDCFRPLRGSISEETPSLAYGLEVSIMIGRHSGWSEQRLPFRPHQAGVEESGVFVMAPSWPPPSPRPLKHQLLLPPACLTCHLGRKTGRFGAFLLMLSLESCLLREPGRVIVNRCGPFFFQ